MIKIILTCFVSGMMTGCYLISSEKTFCNSHITKYQLATGHYEFKSQTRRFIKLKIEKEGKGVLQSPYRKSNKAYPTEISFCKSKIDNGQNLLNMAIHLEDGIQNLAFRWEYETNNKISKLILYPFVVEERKEKNSNEKIALELLFPELQFSFDDSRLIQVKKVNDKFMDHYEEKLITKHDGAFILEKLNDNPDWSPQPLATK